MERYKLSDIDNERFYLLPKSLFNDSEYKTMSLTAKVMYAFLRDRMVLSRKNGWVDENGDIYLYFNQQELSEQLNISLSSCKRAFKELKSQYLIDSVRRGLNLPNRIYIRKLRKTHGSVNLTLPEVSKRTIGSVNLTLPEVSKRTTSDTYVNDTYVSDIAGGGSGELTPAKKMEAEIFKAYQNNIHPIYSPYEMEALRADIQQYGPEWVLRAIKESALQHAGSIKYMEAVLARWQKTGSSEPWKQKRRQMTEPPTREQVVAYCNENQCHIDVGAFFDYYQANGWRTSRGPLKDWKAAVRNWARRDKEKAATKPRESRDEREARERQERLELLQALEEGQKEQERQETERKKKTLPEPELDYDYDETLYSL